MFALKLKLLLSCFVAVLALVNPIQKVFVMTSLQDQFSEADTKMVALKSSLTALLILLFFLLLGEVVFNYVFHVELYAFQITCGVVLFYNGITGLQKGIFIKVDQNISIHDITAVPIAIPMIAGPATITAAVTFPAHYGHFNTIVSIVAALAINLLFMLYAKHIARFLNRFNLMNPLVRIFGLIVATIGVQMTLNGIWGFVVSVAGHV
ncbi:MAG TPA: MarC family protein [Tenuifilaceae bacterium]|jgi:multiple antibiotic resistance protein|nr:MarC family protein [Bacteroidales bacterium]HNT41619.1 MarC family protein [Tenuifilaceae bacterium]MBP8643022.1 MarC family protein [Bacteroidales bacterium]NLI88546.1 MarC family protein [Bacteroidales bacterium]HNY09764.1 MarC family protein [Tenuifilaceae bacterium]